MWILFKEMEMGVRLCVGAHSVRVALLVMQCIHVTLAHRDPSQTRGFTPRASRAARNRYEYTCTAKLIIVIVSGGVQRAQAQEEKAWAFHFRWRAEIRGQVRANLAMHRSAGR